MKKLFGQEDAAVLAYPRPNMHLNVALLWLRRYSPWSLARLALSWSLARLALSWSLARLALSWSLARLTLSWSLTRLTLSWSLARLSLARSWHIIRRGHAHDCLYGELTRLLKDENRFDGVTNLQLARHIGKNYVIPRPRPQRDLALGRNGDSTGL
jgi:hypothetical protein